jgi:hypothetical protein
MNNKKTEKYYILSCFKLKYNYKIIIDLKSLLI